MLCGCDSGEKITVLSFASAFTDSLSIQRTEWRKMRKCENAKTTSLT